MTREQERQVRLRLRLMTKNRVTTKQIGGNDGYQWCVLIDGRVKWNGMTRSEAQWRAKVERETLGKEEQK